MRSLTHCVRYIIRTASIAAQLGKIAEDAARHAILSGATQMPLTPAKAIAAMLITFPVHYLPLLSEYDEY